MLEAKVLQVLAIKDANPKEISQEIGVEIEKVTAVLRSLENSGILLSTV